ncbi:MAG: bile acid:sodium symporter family protein [Prevotellaceae bacterium]|nr:bile acid:sodium symporter family protein [Prevotellaceae bacterium]
MNTIWIVLPILTILMFELGLNLKWRDFTMIASRPKPLLAGLFGQLVILPVIAYLLCWAMHLPPLFMIGFVLIACSPGGSSSNVFSMLAKGDVALSVSMTACSSIITMFTIPLIMSLVCSGIEGTTETIGATETFHLPVGKLLMQNIVLMFIPIIIGIFVRKSCPNAANKIHKVLSKIAFPALILLATVFFIQNKQAIIDNFLQLGVAATLLLVLALAAGGGLSRCLRLTGKERRTIIIEIGMQNAAQAIAVATSPFVFNNDTIAIPAIIYALMMNVVLLIYVAVIKK